MKGTTKKTAAKKTAAAPKTRAMNVLPRLPEGWEYHLAITGPQGESIKVNPSEVTSDAFEVAVVTRDSDDVRVSTVSPLSGALQTVGKAAKALADLAKKRHALAAAENDALGFLGDDSSAGAAGSVGD